jgi:hypothetical protein
MGGKIPLSELWSAEHIPNMITDHTPQWFAEGSFSFSADNRIADSQDTVGADVFDRSCDGKGDGSVAA